MVLAPPCVAVAVNVTAEPARPVTVAVAPCAPAMVPRTRVAVARPVAPVTDEGLIEPPAVVLAGGCTTKFTLLATAGPTATVGCWVIATPSTVAATTLVSALVELSVPVVTPFTSVAAAGVRVLPVVGDAVSTTVLPLIG